MQQKKTNYKQPVLVIEINLQIIEVYLGASGLEIEVYEEIPLPSLETRTRASS